MDKFDKIEYSVCPDCIHYIANGEVCDINGDSEEIVQNINEAMKREIDGRNAHFCLGIEPTEDDPEGLGYDSFTWSDCELCGSKAGSRYGATLLIRL